MRKNLKGISVLISYVLLVVLSIAMAAIVYTVIRYKSTLPEEIKCPEGTSIYLYNYSCDAGLNKLNLTIKNNGFFNISGVSVRVFNSTGICNQTRYGFSPPMSPNEIEEINIICSNPTKVSILPFRGEIGREIYCSNALIEQQISC